MYEKENQNPAEAHVHFWFIVAFSGLLLSSSIYVNWVKIGLNLVCYSDYVTIYIW
jgi:hypothetical protein